MLSFASPTVLAIDAGTTAVKAAIVTPGAATDLVERRTVTRRVSGMIDPTRFWEAVAEAIGALVAVDSAIDAVTVTGQGDGLWMIDADGEPPAKALEWTSRLGSAYISQWESNGTLDEHFNDTGTVLWSGSAAPLWRWLVDRRPDVVERVETLFCAKDWINYKLCGAVATDMSDASIPFLDLRDGTHRPSLLDRLGCHEVQDRLAPIVPAGTELGGITAEAAAITGLRVGTPVLMGCLDTCALVHGACLSEVGDALAVLGTTAGIMVMNDRLDTSIEPMGATLKMHEADRYLRCAGATSGTSTLDWYLNTLHGNVSSDRHDGLWAAVNNGRPGVTMLPYLAGERAPFIAPEATGGFLGITTETTQADIARSVIMGITMSLRHNLDAAGPPSDRPLVLTGGGASSVEWSQLVADVTGRVVAVDDRPHVATVGVAALALGRPSIAHHDRIVYEPQQDFEPEYRTYLELVEALRPVWARHRHDSNAPNFADESASIDLD